MKTPSSRKKTPKQDINPKPDDVSELENSSHGMPPDKCTACGYTFDMASNVSNKDRKEPRPGDLSVCIKCGHLTLFGPDLKVQELTEQQHKEVMKDDQVKAAVALITLRNLLGTKLN